MKHHDLQSVATPFHLLVGSSYTSSTNSASFNLAAFGGGAIVAFNVLSNASDTCVVTLAHSNDDTTFTGTSYTWTEPVGTPSTTRFFYIHPHKVGPFVRFNVNPGGTLTGGSLTAVALTRTNGELPATTYAIDTGV